MSNGPFYFEKKRRDCDHGVSNLKTHYRFHCIMSSWQICPKLATWRRTVLSLYTSHATFPFTFPLFPSNSPTFSYLTSSHVPFQTETQFHQNKTTRRKSIDVNWMGLAVKDKWVSAGLFVRGFQETRSFQASVWWVRWAFRNPALSSLLFRTVPFKGKTDPFLRHRHKRKCCFLGHVLMQFASHSAELLFTAHCGRLNCHCRSAYVS